MHIVHLSTKAQKDLKKIKKESLRARVFKKLLQLQDNPKLGKKLSGKLKNCYSARVWPYGIIYTINQREKTVLIVRVGQR